MKHKKSLYHEKMISRGVLSIPSINDVLFEVNGDKSIFVKLRFPPEITM